MTQTPIIHRKAYKRRIARNTRRIMYVLIVVLAVPALALMLNLGLDSCPMWLLANRSKILGLLLFGVVILSFSSPIIVEFNTNPRPLSGPGKDPRMPPTP